MEYYAQYDFRNSLCHHGVKGQKLGVTRTPTELGNRVTKLSAKNESMEKKISKTSYKKSKLERKAGKLGIKAEKEEWKHGHDSSVPIHKKQAETKYKADKLGQKIAKMERKTYKNKEIIRALNKQMKEISKQEIEDGKIAVENSLKNAG